MDVLKARFGGPFFWGVMAAGDIIQSKTGYVSDTAGNLVITLDSDFTPGNTLVIVLSWQHYLKGHSDSLINGITDNKSHTFARRTAKFRIGGDYTATGDLWSEIWDCVGAADASPSTHIAVTIDPKRTEANNRGFAYVAEVEGITAFSQVGVMSGGGVSSTSVTSTSATLTPTEICFSGLSTFASGVSSPTGWDSLASNTNGTNSVHGFGAAKKLITTSVAAEAIWTYTSATYGAAATIATYTLSSSDYKLEFEFDSSVFTSADTAIEGYVFFGGLPDVATSVIFFDSLAGDATAGTMFITSGLPADLTISDTVYGVFYNGTDTSGLIAGTVVAA